MQPSLIRRPWNHSVRLVMENRLLRRHFRQHVDDFLQLGRGLLLRSSLIGIAAHLQVPPRRPPGPWVIAFFEALPRNGVGVFIMTVCANYLLRNRLSSLTRLACGVSVPAIALFETERLPPCVPAILPGLTSILPGR